MSVQQMIALIETKNDELTDNEGFHTDPQALKLFVGVRPTIMPDNRFLSYATVDRLLEVANLPERTVVLFGADDAQVRLASVLCQHAIEIGVSLVLLDGIPDSEVTAGLKDAFFGLPSASHAAFISEMAMDEELALQRKATSGRKIDEEEGRITRSDGTVKEVEIGVISIDEDE
jgi:hypothetical protein